MPLAAAHISAVCSCACSRACGSAPAARSARTADALPGATPSSAASRPQTAAPVSGRPRPRAGPPPRWGCRCWRRATAVVTPSTFTGSTPAPAASRSRTVSTSSWYAAQCRAVAPSPWGRSTSAPSRSSARTAAPSCRLARRRGDSLRSGPGPSPPGKHQRETGDDHGVSRAAVPLPAFMGPMLPWRSFLDNATPGRAARPPETPFRPAGLSSGSTSPAAIRPGSAFREEDGFVAGGCPATHGGGDPRPRRGKRAGAVACPVASDTRRGDPRPRWGTSDSVDNGGVIGDDGLARSTGGYGQDWRGEPGRAEAALPHVVLLPFFVRRTAWKVE